MGRKCLRTIGEKYTKIVENHCNWNYHYRFYMDNKSLLNPSNFNQFCESVLVKYCLSTHSLEQFLVIMCTVEEQYHHQSNTQSKLINSWHCIVYLD